MQHILIADDSLTERTHLAQILQDAGYHVLTASSGNEAASIATKKQPDLIFLDIIMEDGDGYKTCRTLKRDKKTQQIPIIMVSSKSNSVDKQWALQLGASAYITKPYAAEDILTEIENI